MMESCPDDIRFDISSLVEDFFLEPSRSSSKYLIIQALISWYLVYSGP